MAECLVLYSAISCFMKLLTSEHATRKNMQIDKYFNDVCLTGMLTMLNDYDDRLESSCGHTRHFLVTEMSPWYARFKVENLLIIMIS